MSENSHNKQGDRLFFSASAAFHMFGFRRSISNFHNCRETDGGHQSAWTLSSAPMIVNVIEDRGDNGNGFYHKNCNDEVEVKTATAAITVNSSLQ